MNKFKLLEFPNSKVELNVSTSIVGNLLEVVFDYSQYKGNWIVSSKFSDSDSFKNWKLWEFDVFEAFLQFRKSKLDFESPYIEMQISPKNQRLNLLIIRPRAIFQTLLHDQFTAKIDESLKEVKLSINLNDLELERKDYLYGGFFSCLGPKEKRKYFSNIDLEGKLDFHRPKNFVRIQ